MIPTPSIEFFTTTAQVLPTIAIAIVLADQALLGGIPLHSAGSDLKRVRLRSPRSNFAFVVLITGEVIGLLSLLYWPLPVQLATPAAILILVSMILSLASLVPAGSTIVRKRGDRARRRPLRR